LIAPLVLVYSGMGRITRTQSHCCSDFGGAGSVPGAFLAVFLGDFGVPDQRLCIHSIQRCRRLSDGHSDSTSSGRGGCSGRPSHDQTPTHSGPEFSIAAGLGLTILSRLSHGRIYSASRSLHWISVLLALSQDVYHGVAGTDLSCSGAFLWVGAYTAHFLSVHLGYFWLPRRWQCAAPGC